VVVLDGRGDEHRHVDEDEREQKQGDGGAGERLGVAGGDRDHGVRRRSPTRPKAPERIRSRAIPYRMREAMIMLISAFARQGRKPPLRASLRAS
jgi:hypothetical protein